MSILSRSSKWFFGVAVVGCLVALAARVDVASADVRLSSLFTDHMVLQRDLPCRVWGWASPNEQVTVAIAGQTKNTEAGADEKWMVTLDPLSAGGPHTLVVEGRNRVAVEDVLVGEVWICSGQSNMQWAVQQSIDADLEALATNYPHIRLITVPQVGTQEPQEDFKGQWQVCTADSARGFSAVGYFFGRQLHQTLGVPVGLIDNAWGGSSCEAWIPRDLLKKDDIYQPLMERWENIEETYDHDTKMAEFRKQLETWKQKADQARQAGKKPPARPGAPRNPLVNQHRPANLYNGVLQPLIGYTMRGVIWYQGESNASRAYQYREMFPLMIQSWRDAWKQDDFPFYWVQLADFRAEVSEPAESDWAELREAQTMAMRLPNTGQAVIVDLGEANDIHPRNKQDVAMRLARWALAKDYGKDIVYRSPEYKSMETKGNRAVLTFEHVGGGLRTFDVRDVKGFTIAGDDKRFVHAQARIAGKDRVEVWSDAVASPVSVRYAWSDNPICNLQNREGLPVTPFRTDTWPGKTADAR